MNEAQSGDGYKCSCGFITDAKTKFFSHLGTEGRRAKRERIENVHHSVGRVNVLTGEITMPPWEERTVEQQLESTHGRRVEKLSSDGTTRTVREKSDVKNVLPVRTTDVLSQATEVRFIPRIFTCTYTPVMQSALVAAQREWKWRQNMPFENFLDTIIYNYFYEHGIQLAGYIVNDTISKQIDSQPEKQPEATPA